MLWIMIFQVAFAEALCLSQDIAVQHSLQVLQQYFMSKDCSSTLKKLENVRSISLVDQQLQDISMFDRAKKLEYLNLSKNQISDISSLSSLQQLKWLDLSENQISTMVELPTQSLETFWCVGCMISSWETSSKMVEIHELSLRNNQLTDVDVTQFPKLRAVLLSDNQITDPSSLAKKKKIVVVELSGNPLEKEKCPQGKKTARGLRRACAALFEREE